MKYLYIVFLLSALLMSCAGETETPQEEEVPQEVIEETKALEAENEALDQTTKDIDKATEELNELLEEL